MEQLLKTYSIQEILLFIVMLAAAIKGVVSWIEWAISKLKTKFNKEEETREIRDDLKKNIEEIKKSQLETNNAIQVLTGKVNLLMDSDKDDIKAWITEKHHHFCYELGYIDDYNLDCIEKRYSHYEVEGGNSFVRTLMDEIRELPKKGSEYLYEPKNNENE